jgi:4-hydroxybenzoate polyprenyltransferase
VILPLIDFYATACDWMPTSGRPPNGLWWFVIVSFLNGFIIEIGRKIRAPHEEEAGVETYSALWGRTAAVRCWLLAMLLTGLAAFEAARRIDFLIPVAVVLAALWGMAFLTGRTFLRTDQRSGKPIEMLSGVWTLCLYLVLGVVPMLGRMLP